MPSQPPVACYECDHGLPCAKHAGDAAPVVVAVPALRFPEKDDPAVRKLLNDPRWKHPIRGNRIRKLSKNPVCEDIHGIGCRKPATQVHHKIDHHGNPVLFFNFANLMSLCASCHSKHTAATHGHGGQQIDKRPSVVDGKVKEYGG